MRDPSHVRVSGPLEPFALGFARSLVRQGYTCNSATLQLHLMAHLSRWLAGQSLGVSELRMTDVGRFLSIRRRAGYTNYLSAKAMWPMLTYLRDEGVTVTPPPAVAKGPVDVLLGQYRQYLVRERRIGHATTCNYVNAVRPFLCGQLSRDRIGLDWASLNAADVTAFVVARTPGQGRSAAKMTVTALRSLLGFLYADGIIARRLTAAVPSSRPMRPFCTPTSSGHFTDWCGALDSDRDRRHAAPGFMIYASMPGPGLCRVAVLFERHPGGSRERGGCRPGIIRGSPRSAAAGPLVDTETA